MPARMHSLATSPNSATLEAFLGVLKNAWDTWNAAHLFVAYFQVHTTIFVSVHNRFEQMCETRVSEAQLSLLYPTVF